MKTTVVALSLFLLLIVLPLPAEAKWKKVLVQVTYRALVISVYVIEWTGFGKRGLRW